MVAYAPRYGEQEIPYGSVRQRMVSPWPASSRAHRIRTPQAALLAGDTRRRLLHSKERLPLAVAAPRVPALEDGLRLVQAVAHRRDLGAPERRAARASTVAPCQRSEPQRRDSGLPVAQDHRSGRRRAGLRPRKEKVEGRKRHLLVDTEGLVIEARVHSAKVPDEDGIRLLLESARDRLVRLSHLWVDAGYRGRGRKWAEKVPGVSVEVVRKPPTKPVSEQVAKIWAEE
jgi:hypothetical protein